MEQQQTGKRSIALPITLLILVFSVIGNVFLYSQYLQNKQDRKFETGQQIYNAAVESRQYFQDMIPQLDALLQKEQAEERIETNFLIGAIVQKGQAVVDLASLAEQSPSNVELKSADTVATYITDANGSLQVLGNHAGVLKTEELQYLAALKTSFEKMEDIMGKFSTNIKDNRVAIIRLSSGLEWPELVQQLQLVMNAQSAKLAVS